MAKDDECPPDVDVEVKIDPPKVDVKAEDDNVKVEVTAPKIEVQEPEVKVEVKEEKDPGKEYIGSGTNRIKIDLDQPRWDGDTFSGRIKNYMAPRRVRYFFAGNGLQESKQLLKKYLRGDDMDDVTVDEVWDAKHMFDSTFHPDTGEEISLPVRKSGVVPVDGVITGLMLAFYRTIPGIILGQWAQQTYTSAYDYANRRCEGEPETKDAQYKMAYVAGTSSAIMTAIGLGSLIKRHHPPVLGRLTPFAGVAAATFIYVPFLNMRMLNDGWPIWDADNKALGTSSNGAAWALCAETLGRIGLIAPPLLIPPFIVHHLECNQKLFCRYPWARAPINILLCCLCLKYITPIVRATYPDRSPVPLETLEEEIQDELKKKDPLPDPIYIKNRLS